MIKNIKFKNFTSFKEEVVLDLERKNKKDIYKNVFFLYGHNASGKTNLLKAFSFLSWFSTLSWKDLEENEDIPLEPYRFCKENNEPTTFEITFSGLDKKTYKYLIELNEKLILKEQLWIQNEKKRTTFSTLFKRTWNSKSEKYTADFRNFFVGENFINDLMQKRKNCTVLSAMDHVKQDKVLLITIPLWTIFSNVTSIGKVSRDQFDEIVNVSKFYRNDVNIQSKVIDLIKYLDIEIDHLEWEEKNLAKNSEKIFLPKFHHKKDNGETYSLPFIYESSGTKNLYIILRWIVKILETGGIAALDEIDADLHPLVVRKLIKYFADPKNNPTNAQLIISTHSTELMNLLSKENILFAEKNSNLESSIFSLDDISGVRNTEDFSRKYLSGAYGGVMND